MPWSDVDAIVELMLAVRALWPTGLSVMTVSLLSSLTYCMAVLKPSFSREVLVSSRCACVAFVGIVLTLPALAQGYNVNFGGGPGFPLGKTSDFTNISYNLVAGAGPNLLPHLKMNAEFMFHGLPVQQKIIDQLGVSNVKGRFYSLTGNLILGTSVRRGKSAYLIAGGGWYRRTVEAKQTVLKAGEVCEPAWIWWDVQCVNGIVPVDVTVGSRTSSADGFNVGGGLAFALGDSGANFYAEVRYHRAFTRGVDTTVLPLTFGIRW